MSEEANQTPEPAASSPPQPLMLVAPAEYPPGPYSNFVQVTITPHDFTLHFASYTTPVVTEPPKEPVRVPVRPLASVTIPLNLVRALIGVLEGQAANWQASFGQPLPDHPAPEPPGPTRK